MDIDIYIDRNQMVLKVSNISPNRKHDIIKCIVLIYLRYLNIKLDLNDEIKISHIILS